MKQIVIIGNGFDIFHSIKSSYSDFKEYIQQNESELFYRLETFFDTPDIWSNFEENLSKLDLQAIVEDSFDNIDGDDEHPMRDEAIITDTVEAAINQLTVGLKNCLNSWVLQFVYPANHHKKFNFFTDKTDFISFNYTETLQQLYSVNQVSIVYIHNKAAKQRISHHELEDSDLIIGHSVRASPNIEYRQNSNAGMVNWFGEDAFTDAIRYYKTSFKDTRSNLPKLVPILNNRKEYNKVYIIGHSLSDVDIEYFRHIALQLNDDTQYVITYYGESELQKIQTQAMKFLGTSQCQYIDLAAPSCSLIN